VKPGYFTDFNAFFTCSSEIDMHEAYVRDATGLGGSASPEDDDKEIVEGASIRRRWNDQGELDGADL
jgi:hypothetical protein